MSIFNETVEHKLNGLLEKGYDTVKGLKKVSEHVDNSRLKIFIIEKIRERSSYINELNDLLRKRGMNVTEENGSVSGLIHRTWIDTKAFFSMNNDASMFDEVRNGEMNAIEDYDHILNNCDLESSVSDLLIKQKNAIQANYDRVDYLEEIY